MRTIAREELREKLNGVMTLVEVLDPEYYRKFHLPGAVNVPLGDRFDENIQMTVPDRNSPVVVYCADTDCSASSKAARRMEQLGYRDVLDYEAGKMDWKEAGLPVESES